MEDPEPSSRRPGYPPRTPGREPSKPLYLTAGCVAGALVADPREEWAAAFAPFEVVWQLVYADGRAEYHPASEFYLTTPGDGLK